MLTHHIKRFLRNISPRRVAYVLLGSFITAYGLCNIHAFSDVTEGGVLGLMLLIHHWTGISPAISSVILDAAGYALGWRVLGKGFLGYSALACGAFAVFYALAEPFAPVWPWLAQTPLAAAIVGAVFVGVGSGLCVRAGGAASGDDALAMALSRKLNVGIQHVYFVFDVTVLLLSLSYIPWQRIAYSLLTVILSGQLIGLMQRVKLPGLPDQ